MQERRERDNDGGSQAATPYGGELALPDGILDVGTSTRSKDIKATIVKGTDGTRVLVDLQSCWDGRGRHGGEEQATGA